MPKKQPLFDLSTSVPLPPLAKPLFDVSTSEALDAPTAPHPTDALQDNKIGPVSASKQPVRDWLDSAEHDLRQGGSRTAVGRVLGQMQGRGDKGYSGLESGQSKEVANTMGSVPLGAVEAARGVANTYDHPVKGPLQAVGGLMHMGEIPGMMLTGGESQTVNYLGEPIAAKLAGKAVGVSASKLARPLTEMMGSDLHSAFQAAMEKLPTAARGAGKLNEVAEAANTLPVTLNRTQSFLSRATQLADTGAKMPESVRLLIQRYSNPKQGALSYREARDFYSNLSGLSAEEGRNLTPSMRYQLGKIVESLKHDIGDTAMEVDKASLYYAGMKDYARAKKAARIGNAIKDAITSKVVKTAIGAAGGSSAGYYAVKKIGAEF